jgi:hypothetical protein
MVFAKHADLSGKAAGLSVHGEILLPFWAREKKSTEAFEREAGTFRQRDSAQFLFSMRPALWQLVRMGTLAVHRGKTTTCK